MDDFSAKWISICDFYNLKILNVFHKEIDSKEITHDDKYKNKHILFRKKVIIDDLKKAIMRISADDYYKLYINGKFVTQGPAPAYNFHYYYNEIDVSEYLKNGENTIAVHTYYQGLINRVWVSGDLRHGMALELFVNGTKIAESDETWKCAYHTGYSECGKFGYETQFAEAYDAGASECGFELPEFDDAAWEYAHFKTNCDYVMFRQPTKQLEIYDVKPKFIRKTSNGYFIDFGFEAVGYFKLCATGKKGDVITLKYGEELNEDGTVRYKMRCNCNYIEKFVLSGKESDKLCQFDYKAFRYVEVVLPDDAEIINDTIAFTVRHYPFVPSKKYNGSNKKIKAVYKLCSDTLKYGVQECFVDCPTREKGQYMGDVTFAGLAHMILTGNSDMMEKALENYCESSFICKGLMAVAPSSLMQEIADYSLQFPFQVLSVYNFTQDIDFLKRMYPFVMNVYNYFSKYRCENGLIQGVKEKWNLVDWPANLRDNYDFPLERPIGSGFHNVINGFYLAMLGHINKIRLILGEYELQDAIKTKESYIKSFYNKNLKLFVDSIGSAHASYHSNVIAMFANATVDEENRREIINLICKKKFTAGGLYMAFFAGYVLKMSGETAKLEELIADDDAWINMIKQGATTCFEAWGKEQKWNTSLFHPCGVSPIVLLD